MTSGQGSNATVRYHERRGLSGEYLFMVAVTVAAVAWFAYSVGVPAWEFNEVGAWLIVLTGFAFVHGMFFSRWGPEAARIRVDDHGLRVRRFRLPAAQIGKVWQLEPGSGRRAHFSSRLDRQWLGKGICAYSWFSGAPHAVYVEQRRPNGTRRPWLMATDHPADLADAVRHARAAAGGPCHHPGDRPPPPTTDPAAPSASEQP